MRSNDRITYSNQIFGISEPNVSGAWNTSPRGPRLHICHGVQSIDINTKFNNQQIMEFGQVDAYEISEDLSEVELTVTKVLDGYPLIYTTSTCSILDSGFLSLGLPGSKTSDKLISRLGNECGLHLGIFSEYDNTINEKNAITQVYMSGMKVSNIQYNISNNEAATETITFIGSHKEWDSGCMPVLIDSGNTHSFQNWKEFLPDQPSGQPIIAVAKRENFDMKESILPASIIKTFNSKLNMLTTIPEKGNGQNSGINNIHINSITINVSPSYEDLFELGKKSPFAKKLVLPVNVSCDVEILAISGDFVSVLSRGTKDLAQSSRTSGNNTTNETMVFALNNGYNFNLGNQNRLISVNYGGSVKGGNSTIIFSYENLNNLYIFDSASGSLIDKISPQLRLEYKQDHYFYDPLDSLPNRKAKVFFDFSEPVNMKNQDVKVTIEGQLGGRTPLNMHQIASETIPSKFVYAIDSPFNFYEGTGILDISGVYDTASGYIMNSGLQSANYFNNNNPISSSVYLDFCEPLRMLVTGIENLVAISGNGLDPKYSHYTSKANYIIPRSQPTSNFDIAFHEPVFFTDINNVLVFSGIQHYVDPSIPAVGFDVNHTLTQTGPNFCNCSFTIPDNKSGILTMDVKANSFRDKSFNYNRPGIIFQKDKFEGDKQDLNIEDFIQLKILFDRTLASGTFEGLSVPPSSGIIPGIFNFNKPMDVSVSGAVVSNNNSIRILDVRFNSSDNKQILFNVSGNYSGTGDGISYNLTVASGTFTDIFGNKNLQIVSSGISKS